MNRVRKIHASKERGSHDFTEFHIGFFVLRSSAQTSFYQLFNTYNPKYINIMTIRICPLNASLHHYEEETNEVGSR